jgi:hypothetical protein
MHTGPNAPNNSSEPELIVLLAENKIYPSINPHDTTRHMLT